MCNNMNKTEFISQFLPPYLTQKHKVIQKEQNIHIFNTNIAVYNHIYNSHNQTYNLTRIEKRRASLATCLSDSLLSALSLTSSTL